LNFHFSAARSAVAAKGAVLEAIHRYKYQRALFLEPFLAELLTASASLDLRQRAWDLIIPVPLHPAKEREREFNQAHRLAGHLSHATGIPVNGGMVKRVLATPTQTLLTREERMHNMRNAFEVRKDKTLKNLKLVLVDDVFTTGATTDACAKALRRAGAAEVCVWTVARGI
jgi:ComF family protein